MEIHRSPPRRRQKLPLAMCPLRPQLLRHPVRRRTRRRMSSPRPRPPFHPQPWPSRRRMCNQAMQSPQEPTRRPRMRRPPRRRGKVGAKAERSTMQSIGSRRHRRTVAAAAIGPKPPPLQRCRRPRLLLSPGCVAGKATVWYKAAAPLVRYCVRPAPVTPVSEVRETRARNHRMQAVPAEARFCFVTRDLTFVRQPYER